MPEKYTSKQTDVLHANDLELDQKNLDAKQPLNFFTEIHTKQGEHIYFSSIDNFPNTGEDRRIATLPKLLSEHSRRDNVWCQDTYQRTSKQETWKQDMGEVIRSYLSSQRGIVTVKMLEILDLQRLSPRQAVRLSLHLVRDLTRYNDKDKSGLLSRADKVDAVTLLKEGLERYEDDAWDGNGVCRHFSDFVRIVFDAIKSLQHGNALVNTHCTTEMGWGYMEATEDSLRHQPPHAWNAFFQVSDDEPRVDVAIVDVTWSRATEQGLKNLQYTPQRTEPFVHDALRLEAYDDPNVLKSAIEFYCKRFDAISNQIEKKDYLALRFVTAFPDSLSPMDIDLPPRLKTQLERFFIRRVRTQDVSWSTLLEKIRKARLLGIDKTDLIDSFLSIHPLEELSRMKNNQGFIAALIEELSIHPSFKRCLNQNACLRAMVRGVHPEMLRPFRPDKESTDLCELRYLISRSEILQTHVRDFLRKKYNKNTLRHLALEDANEVLNIAHTLCLKRNSNRAKSILARANKWDLLYNFATYWHELSRSEKDS